ncbi:MAG: hypothetical protein J5719_02120 [Bacteroidales bacterium]|nr:hypothetical protein [Bacteroidales bacterium]
MKKLILLAFLGIMTGSLFAQSCINDVSMYLINGQVGKARKTIDECLPGNENSAMVWLYRGNVYLRTYDNEIERSKKDPNYVKKYPDAVWTAYESFLKAVTIDPKVKPSGNLLDPITGQILCGGQLYAMGETAMKKNKTDEAYKYFNAAAKCFKLDKQNPNLKSDLGLIYANLADLANSLGDKEGYKKALLEGVNAGGDLAYLYTSMYDIYKAEKDTVNCGKIIAKGKANVPAKDAADIYATELDYFAMTGQIDELNAACDKLGEQYANQPAVLNMIAGYLNNSGQFEKAELFINKGLEQAPNDFDLNQQMGYRYFYEAIKYQTLIEEAQTNREWDKMKELRETETAITEKAHEWVEKAYNINPEDRLNNIMFQQLKVKLRKEVPAELKAKVDSYQQK